MRLDPPVQMASQLSHGRFLQLAPDTGARAVTPLFHTAGFGVLNPPDDDDIPAISGAYSTNWRILQFVRLNWQPQRHAAGHSGGGGARGGGRPQARPNQEPESKPESDRARAPESESTGESDRVRTQEPESTEEPDRVWTQEPESTEEPDYPRVRVHGRARFRWTYESDGPRSPGPKKSDSVCSLASEYVCAAGQWVDAPIANKGP
jgi:hypothetical protein